MLQIDNERLLILRNTLEVKDIREGKTDRLKAPSGSPKITEVAFQLLPFFLLYTSLKHGGRLQLIGPQAVPQFNICLF